MPFARSLSVPLFTVLLLCLAPLRAVFAQAEACKVQELMLDQSSAPGATAPAFSPDNKSVIYGKTVGTQTFLFQSERQAGHWGTPHLASFSGAYTDIEPAFSPDGRYLVFSSNRPLASGGSLADGNYDGKVRVGHGGRLWKVSHTARGWGEPTPLPGSVNEGDSLFSPAIQRNGTLYFMRPVNAGEKFHLYLSPSVAGHYTTPQRVSFSNLDAFGDFDPAVSKDGSLLIFSSPRPPSLPHRSDLFIVYRTQAGWSAPVDLRTLLCEDVFGVEARLSPDETTLYFTNSRRLPSDPPESPEHPYVQHTWQVDLSTVRQPKETVTQ